MTLDRAVQAFAGVMILISLLLTHFVSPWFWLLTAFIGFNLFQSAFTGFCPAAMVMRRMGIGRNSSASCGVR
ncbi:MAG: DUF2892 domain-containing protein [Dokdonella sp.]